MNEATMRELLVNAMKARAMFYYAFYKEFSAEIGAEKTAEIIADELSLPLADVTRMMKGTEMVPCDKQVTAKYLGSSSVKGQFVDTLLSTADFLVKQDRLPKLLPRKDFESFLVPSYVEKVSVK